MNPKYKPNNSIQISISNYIELGDNKVSILWNAANLDTAEAYDGLSIVDKSMTKEDMEKQIMREYLTKGLK